MKTISKKSRDGSVQDIGEWGSTKSDGAVCFTNSDNHRVEEDYDDLNILIVDDSRSIHALIEDTLCKKCGRGIAYSNAFNGEDALNKMKACESKIDLIILDWEMPVMNGLDFLKHLKKAPEYLNIPVLMLTQKSEMENMMEGLEEGAYFYLTKPFEKNHFEAIVRQALQLS